MDRTDMDRRQFLKCGAVGVGAITVAAGGEEKSMVASTSNIGAGRVENWAGNISYVPKSVEFPRSLAALQLAVANSKKVRVIGSVHSFNAFTETADTVISLDNLNRVLSVDVEQKLVKVEGGCKLALLTQALESRDLCLPSLGDIDEQTVGGLVSTGTHGTGMQWGSFSDSTVLAGLDLVLADGSLLSLNDDGVEIEFLKAARLALGGLGVVYSVTFRCEPAHNLELKSKVVSLSEALSVESYQKNDHYEFFHFPFTKKCQIITRNKTDLPLTKNRFGQWFNNVVMENLVLGSLLEASAMRPRSIRKVMALITRLAGSERYVAGSAKVMSSKRFVKFYEMEYCLPIDKASEALQALAETAERFAKGTEPFYQSFPTEVRFIRGDQGNLLTPTIGRDSVYIAVQSHKAFGNGYPAFFKAAEDIFRSLDGRPHWAKLFYRNPITLYENAERFVSVRNELDPSGKFLNKLFTKMLAGEPYPFS